MPDSAFGNGDIAALNAKLHENTVYNVFHIGVNAVAVFTGGMTSTMKCFVAGTLVMTAAGLVAIETVKEGDYVLSTNSETMETAYKPVLETYVRETDKLVHLTIHGEEIITTYDHPFYVLGQGFVNAINLCIGMELVDAGSGILRVEQIYREDLCDETRTVYNFQVEDYHTYHVGTLGVLVHNADYVDGNKVIKSDIPQKTLNNIKKKWGQKGIDAFEKAMNKGMVGPEGQSGIKSLKGKPLKGKYTHEIKVKNKEYGDYRIYGYQDGDGTMIFDYFDKGLH